MNKLCKNISCRYHNVCRQYETDICVAIMDNVCVDVRLRRFK